MYIQIVAYTFDIVGKILIAYTTLMVHYRMQQEHKIDKAVYSEMKKEKVVAMLGIGLMIIGYLLQLYSI